MLLGLVGKPSVGKSTFFKACTLANVAIAAYPFTTLEANLGVMEIGTRKKRLVLADIPGLIEGASAGRGLGDLFLKHIERTAVIVHLIDLSQLQQGGSLVLWDIYQTIRNELKSYSGELAKKREIIVLTKADLVDGETIKKAQAEFSAHRKKTFVISAQTGRGLEELKAELTATSN